MADSRYFQGHPKGFNITYISTACDGKSIKEDIEKRISFGSNDQAVGWTDSGRAYLNQGLFNSGVKVMDGDREGQVFAVDCSPIAAFANPSYITDGKKIVYHNAIEGTRLDACGTTPSKIIDVYEFDLEEFREFAGSWNDRHCKEEYWGTQHIVISGTSSHVWIGTYVHPPEPKNNTIFPPLKPDRTTVKSKQDGIRLRKGEKCYDGRCDYPALWTGWRP